MNVEVENEQSQNFQERLGQWVSSQGFWFQLRYSFSGGGAKGAFLFHFLKLVARVSVFLVIVAIGVWIFLVRQTDTDGYVESLQEALKEKLSATEVDLKHFDIEQGEFYIGLLGATGDEDTFFTGLDIRSLKCRQGMLDRFREQWDPGLIEISRLDLGLRAGADSDEAAQGMADVLFQDSEKIRIDAIQVADANIRWGYSERTRGAVLGSKMRAQRVPEGWRLRFRGGTFTQNWLKKLEIKELDVLCDRNGVTIEKGTFIKGEGFVFFKGIKIRAGQRPAVSGAVALRKVNVSSIVPVVTRNFVEGTISGEFEVSGSTNSTEGLGFEGDVNLEGEDVLILRDRVHLLRALSVVDAFNNYRRLDFRNGSFHLKSLGGRLEVTDVNLRAGDIFTMEGNMTVRQPTDDESRLFNDAGGANAFGDAILNDDELGDAINLTLEGAAGDSESNRIGFAKQGEDTLFERLGLTIENRRQQEKAAERLFQSNQYGGKFTVTLPKDAFDRAPKLAERYPHDPQTGRIVVDVPLEGVLYEVTLPQAEEIYKLGTR